MLSFSKLRKHVKPALLIMSSAVLTARHLDVDKTWQLFKLADLAKVTAKAVNNGSGLEIDESLQAYTGSVTTTHRPLRTFSFDSISSYSGNVWHHGKEYYIAVKGMPEQILALCDLTDNEQEAAMVQLHKMSVTGQQVVAVAHITLARQISSLHELSVKERLAFVGFIGLKPIIVPSVRKHIQKLRDKGYVVYLITGKQKDTAAYISFHAAITSHKDRVFDSRRLRVLSGKNLSSTLDQVRVFSRANAGLKDHVAQLLSKEGRAVRKIRDTKELLSIPTK